jgi:hypothetical protein
MAEQNDRRQQSEDEQQLLAEAMADLRAMEMKYGWLPELREAFDKFHRLEAELAQRRKD